MAEYIVCCESLKKADSLMNHIMSNVAPRSNFGVDYWRHIIYDSCGDIMRFVSEGDINTRHILQGFRGTVLQAYEVRPIVSDYFHNYRSIRRLAAIPVSIEEKKKTKHEKRKEEKMKDRSKFVVFDFDGVIHNYKGLWSAPDVIDGEPVEGIKEAIDAVRKAGYFVSVVSVRCQFAGGAQAIMDWLKKHDIEIDHISSQKPHARCYIDDRAICFDGHAETLLDKINNFTPWNGLTI